MNLEAIIYKKIYNRGKAMNLLLIFITHSNKSDEATVFRFRATSEALPVPNYGKVTPEAKVTPYLPNLKIQCLSSKQ